MKMTEAMKKTAKTIGNSFFRFRKQFIKEHGVNSIGDASGEWLYIDHEEEQTIFVMATFETRKGLKEWLKKNQAY